MNSRECIEKKIDELKGVLTGIDELESVKEKLKKIDKLKELTEDVFKDQEEVYSSITGYVNKEINLQKVIIEELGSKIAQVCGVDNADLVVDEVEMPVEMENPGETEVGLEVSESEVETTVDEETEIQDIEDVSGADTEVSDEKVEEEISTEVNSVVSEEELDELTEQMLNDIEGVKEDK